MMHSYTTEVYLPCELKEISYSSKRKPFTNTEMKSVISLAPMSAHPFLDGSLVLFRDGAFFVDNFDMLIAIDSQSKTLEHHLKNYPDWQKELEELNAISAIAFTESNNNLLYSSEAYNYKTKYDGKIWSNFSLAPIILELDITNQCNAYCIHCSRSSNSKLSSMPLNKIANILEQCKQLNIPELLVMGGEPLLHPQFLSILTLAKDLGIRSIRSSSNGLLLTEEMAQKLTPLITHMQISIHGASPNTHDSITRTKGSFSQACTAVRILKSYNIDVDISFTVMEDNEHDIPLMPNLAYNLGASGLRFLALSNIGRGRRLSRISNESRENLGLIIRDLYNKYITLGMKISVGGFPSLIPVTNQATLYGCAAGKTHIHVSHNNAVNPCGSVDGYYLADLDQCKLIEAWHHNKLRKVRKASKCNCAYKHICSGSCKADSDFAYAK